MFETQIKNGMKWLDENHPGWLDKVSTAKLNLACSYNCVIGQVCGDFVGKVNEMFGTGCMNRYMWSSINGFTTNGFGLYKDLTEGWKLAIEQRRTELEEQKYISTMLDSEWAELQQTQELEPVYV